MMWTQEQRLTHLKAAKREITQNVQSVCCKTECTNQALKYIVRKCTSELNNLKKSMYCLGRREEYLVLIWDSTIVDYLVVWSWATARSGPVLLQASVRCNRSGFGNLRLFGCICLEKCSKPSTEYGESVISYDSLKRCSSLAYYSLQRILFVSPLCS